GESLDGVGEASASQKPQETRTNDGANGVAPPSSTTLEAPARIAVGVASAAVAAVATATGVAAATENGLPSQPVVRAPSEPAGAPAPKTDEPMKDEPQHGHPVQSGTPNGDHHNEQQRELEPETATAAQGPSGDDAVVVPPVTSEP